MNKFNLYDFIAVIIPGIFFLWSITFIASIAGIVLNLSFSGDLTNMTVIIVIGYVTGLLLQGVSQGITEKILKAIWGGFPSERWLLDSDPKFSSAFKVKLWVKIKEKLDREIPKVDDQLSIKEQVKILRKKNQEIFYLIYRYIEKDKITDMHQTFNAQYGLFRCLLTTFFLIFLMSLYLLLFSGIYTSKAYMVLIFSFIAIIISYFRVKKRGEDFAKCILDSFCIS